MHWQRRPLIPAALAALAIASAAVQALAQPAPFSEDQPQYRSNKPYPADVRREQRERQEEAGLTWPYSPLLVAGGVDFTDHYFFRGYNYVSSGLIAQPYLQVGYNIYADEHFAITPEAGVWLDITEQEGPENPVHFNEFRGNAGVAVDVGDLRLDFRYVYYSSPSDAFKKFHEVGVDILYDDSRFWDGRRTCLSSLNPSLNLYYEVKDNRDDDENTYFGLGLAPALKPFDFGSVPVTVSFPLTLGGSYDGYYRDADGHNANFGYWEAGVRAALPLGKSAYGMHWFMDAEVDYLQLMARSARAANGFDNDDVVFRVGLSFR